jgi:transcriptional regulator with XRE-family HTH domain
MGAAISVPLVRDRDALAKEIGRRIDEAWVRAGFPSRAEMIRASGLKDANQVHQWARGRAVPRVDLLAEVARVCHVSLDWLVFGADETPPAFVDWLESPTGQQAEEDAKRYLRSLPTHGYKATRAFYDLAYQAWKLGLARDLTPEEAAQMARDSAREEQD